VDGSVGFGLAMNYRGAFYYAVDDDKSFINLSYFGEWKDQIQPCLVHKVEDVHVFAPSLFTLRV